MMSPLPRLVVMISGSGSNLQAILDATQAGELAAQVVAVVSNRRAAFGLERARRAGVPTLYLPLKPFRDAGQSRLAYDRALASKIDAYQPHLIVLAGWMHVLSVDFLDHFPDKVINLHPALPGQFAGTHAIERAFEAFHKGEITYSGCMVHYVVPEVDAGPVIVASPVPIREGDTLESFEARMHATEHKILVQAIREILT